MQLALRVVAIFALCMYSTTALADADDKARAKEAYERATAEYQRGDYAQAATDFAAADALAPSPAALKMALDAAVESDSVGLGLELLERSKRAPANEPLASSIVAAKAKFDGRVIVVTQPAPAATATAPAPAPEDTTASKKLPAWVFWAGAGATAALGGLTLAFGLDATGTHGDFQDAGCTNGTGNYAHCASLRDAGEGAATRTNVMLVSTLVLGVASALVGVLFTQWSAPASR